MFLVYAHITRAFTGKHTNAKIYYFHILALTKLSTKHRKELTRMFSNDSCFVTSYSSNSATVTAIF